MKTKHFYIWLSLVILCLWYLPSEGIKEGAKMKKASSSIICSKCLETGCIYLQGYKLGMDEQQTEMIINKLIN